MDCRLRRPFAPDAPANRLYLDYYEEMGMSKARAQAFYAMTNSVPHHSAKWLRADEMRPWIRPEVIAAPPAIPLTPLPRAHVVLNLPEPERAPLIGYGDMARVTRADAIVAFAKPILDS